MKLSLRAEIIFVLMLLNVLRIGAAEVDYLRAIKPVFTEHCYRCHGASQQKGGLRMDTAHFAQKGGENGPAYEPGKGDQSLLIQALKGQHDTISQMPYKKPPLGDGQIELIKMWIDQGAKAPADEQPQSDIHWAFVPPKRIDPPKEGKGTNPLDAFIQARLQKEGIKPSPEADRITLFRRLHLDLLGLPPTPSEIDAFVKDNKPGAYERLVDRLMASPHYGERWGRWWLDVARYADSNGYSIDAPRTIWKYRDWVINALNRDLPYDQFVIEQMAGDLLPDATIDQKIATGFHRNTQINQEGGIDPEQFRIESVLDRVNTTGTAFLGLTVSCAQCHDHKFDPISQREYYQLYAFFNNTVQDGHGESAPKGVLEIPGEFEPMDVILAEREESEAELERYLNAKGSEVTKWEQALSSEDRDKLPSEVRESLKLTWDQRTSAQKRAVYLAFNKDDAGFKSRHTKLSRLEKREPKPITTLIMSELPEPRESFVFIKGDFTRKGDIVKPGTLAILNQFDQKESPTRLDLARWLVDPKNPLTARVVVNRIWQQYFGKGIVETDNDFGTQGIPPTHPELMDWLACELMSPTVKVSESSATPWSLKHIHRLIVLSATYRQSSHARQDLALVDANNKLLARQNRLRLDAEVVRDVSLSASGLLNDKIGGPSVFPPQPDGVMNLGQIKRSWQASVGPDRYRRGLYTYFWRATPHPALAVFDVPDSFSACTRRLRSNTPLQALTMLNDQAFVEFAQALAKRVIAEGGREDSDRVDFVFRLCLSRFPEAEEKKRLLKLLKDERQALNASPDEVTALAPKTVGSEVAPAELISWTTVARVMLNLDETITRE